MSAVPLPKCIDVTSAGRYRLRAQLSAGSSKVAVRTFDSASDALIAHALAAEARADGRSVIDAIDNRFTPAAAAASSTRLERERQRNASLTMSDVIDEFLAERTAIRNASDPTFRRSLKNGNNTLRPSTLRNDYQVAENHLGPRFGNMHPSELTRHEITKWMIELAELGIGTDFAGALLKTLRVLVGRAPLSTRPEDFPWKGCAPVKPANPRRPLADPSRWGGLPGSAPPVLPFSDGRDLAHALAAADRLVVYCEHYGGPRIGEVFGLELGDFSYVNDYLWVKIQRQCLETNEVVPWVKTDAGYRSIPLPGILAEYIELYVERYHDVDLANLTPEHRSRRLIVNPAGRDLEGRHLSGVRSNFASRMTTVKTGTEFDYETLGYHLSSHHLRKSCSTYLLNARPILRHITDTLTRAFGDETMSEVDRLRLQLESERLAHPEYEPMHVSKYLGHRHDGQGDEAPASVVTLSHYNLSIDAGRPLEAIADVIDKIARFEVGSLLDDPDEWDLLPVHPLDDPDWVTVEEAVEMIGITDSNVLENMHKGRLDGHLAWRADGGYLRNRSSNGDRPRPSVPLFMISRSSIEAFNASRRRPRIKEFEQALGMSNKAVWANFIDTGRLEVERVGNALYYDEAQGNAIVDAIHGGLFDVIKTCGPITEQRLHREFNKRHGHLLNQGRATSRWITHWTQTLIDQGRVKLRSNKSLYVPES